MHRRQAGAPRSSLFPPHIRRRHPPMGEWRLVPAQVLPQASYWEGMGGVAPLNPFPYACV
jgi:hypothetical protein